MTTYKFVDYEVAELITWDDLDPEERFWYDYSVGKTFFRAIGETWSLDVDFRPLFSSPGDEEIPAVGWQYIAHGFTSASIVAKVYHDKDRVEFARYLKVW